MILKLGTKLDSDELYCVTKKQPHIAYQFLYLFIFLSLQWKFLSEISQLLLEPPVKISVSDFSAPIGASVFKFCVHLKVGKVYCLNENKDANHYFAFFFQFFIFSFCRSYIIEWTFFFCQRFLSNYLTYDSEIWYKA